MISQQLATNIKYYRNQSGWTQHQLADQLKVSRSVIAKWESGDVFPDLPTLIKLSQLFNQTVDKLLGLNRHPDQLLSDFQQFYQVNHDEEQAIDESFLDLINFLIKNPDLREQLDQLKNLSIKQQKSVLRVMRSIINEVDKM